MWCNRYKRAAVAGTAIVAAGLYYANLEPVPITGRQRFNILSHKLMVKIGQDEAEDWLEDHQERGGHLIHFWDERTTMTKRVMKRLVHASGLRDLDWRIYVFDETVLRASVLPDGSVRMYSGMFDLCQDEDGLAALLGHEIAHVVAGHSAEMLSARLARNTLVSGVCFLAAGLPGLLLFGMWNVLGGYIFDDILYHLPKNRMLESEADYIGLMLMAEAGYNPQQAVEFWRRMQEADDEIEEVDLEYMRTHPLSKQRVEKLLDWMPQAVAKHRQTVEAM